MTRDLPSPGQLPRDPLEILAAALDEPPEEREGYLRSACGADSKLLTDVRALLHSHESMGSFLKPVGASDVVLGDRLDRYEIISRIGEGGFGDVFRARQVKPVTREVALKFLRRCSPEALARFDAERQVLASMEHEYIARLYDAGESPTGQPFLVMEYIAGGTPLTNYADTHRLDVPHRLELMVKVCEGVQHAHLGGVIHRDLKPSNILVTGEPASPRVKIIDFGIAKLHHSDDSSATLTSEGKIVGTPAYLAPEQVRAEGRIDIRADLYALGAIMYELICGECAVPPGHDHADWIQRLLTEVPARPTDRMARLSVAERRGRLEARCLDQRAFRSGHLRELDWIPMHAIEKEPLRRYQSAAEIAADIRRYLRGEALSVGPPTTIYKLGKLARRHRTAIVATATVLIVVAAGVSSTVIALSRAATQAVVAEASNRRAEGTKEFSRQVISALNPSGSFEATRMRTLALIDKAIADTHIAFQGDATTRPEVLDTIGQSFRAAGKLDLAEPCLRRAFEMRHAALGLDNPATWNSAHELAYLYDDMGNATEAEPLARQAVAEQTRLLGALHNDTLASVQLLGIILASRAGTAQEGQQLLEDTLRSAREVWGADSVSTAYLENNTAQCYKKADRTDLARPLYEHALSVMRTQLGDDDPETLSVASNLAGAYSIGGDADRARSILVDLVPRCRRVLGDEHPQTLRTMNNLGAVSETLDRLDDAETWYTRSLEVQRRALPAGHPDILSTLSNLSIVHYKRNTPESLRLSESLLKEALDQQVLKYGERDIRTLKSVNNLAMLYDRMGKPEAGAMYERLLASAPAVLGAAHVDTLIYTSNAADWFERSGNVNKAQELFELAASVSAKERGESDFAALWAASDLAVFWRNRERFDVAIAMHERLVALARAAKVPTNNLGVFLTGYGKTLIAAKRFSEAVLVLTEAEGMLAKVLGEESPQLDSTRKALTTAQEKVREEQP